MNKKIRIIIFSWILAALTFLVEQYYLHDYINLNQMKLYAEKTGSLLGEVDQKIGGLVSTGQLNYLIWTEGSVFDELRLVKAQHPLIQDVLIFSTEFHLMDSTSDRFSNSEIIPLLESAGKEKTRIAVIRDGGYFHVYPVIGEKQAIKAYVVAVLNVPPYLNEGSVFLMDITRGHAFWNDPGYLNKEDARDVQKKLASLNMDHSGILNLNMPDKQEILWSYYPPRNIYFGYIHEGKPLYGYIYFYALILSAISSILLLMSAKSKHSRKMDVYEQIIQNNMQTLAEMKKGMEFIIADSRHEKVIEVESVVSDLVEEFAEAAPSPAFYRKPDKFGGEVLISDFILLDPLDTRWYKPLKRKAHVPDIEKASRLSRAAFTPELLNLMDEISKRDQTESRETEVQRQPRSASEGDLEISKGYRRIEKDSFTSALEKLYSTDEPGEELDIILENIRIRGKADGLAVMFFDRRIGCFTVETSAGLDASWSRNFYLLSSDSVLNCPPSGSNNIPVSDSLLQNSFFRKRIPSEYINRMGAIKLMTLQDKEMPVRAALFYWRDGLLSQEFSIDSDTPLTDTLAAMDTGGLERGFTEILPVLNAMYIKREKENKHPEESYRDIYNTLKSFTILSDKKITILHAVLSLQFGAEFRAKLQEFCKQNFKGFERYIVNNPNHLIFLLNETSEEVLEEYVLTLDPEAQVRVLKYPELGKNLFAYL